MIVQVCDFVSEAQGFRQDHAANRQDDDPGGSEHLPVARGLRQGLGAYRQDDHSGVGDLLSEAHGLRHGRAGDGVDEYLGGAAHLAVVQRGKMGLRRHRSGMGGGGPCTDDA